MRWYFTSYSFKNANTTTMHAEKGSHVPLESPSPLTIQKKCFVLLLKRLDPNKKQKQMNTCFEIYFIYDGQTYNIV